MILIYVANVWNCRLCTFLTLIHVVLGAVQQSSLYLALICSSPTNHHFKILSFSHELIALYCCLWQLNLIVCFLHGQTVSFVEVWILWFCLVAQLWSYQQHGLELSNFGIGLLCVILAVPPALGLAEIALQILLSVGLMAKELWSGGLILLIICWLVGWTDLLEGWRYVRYLFFG